MTTHLEIEYKVQLSQSQHTAYLSHFPNALLTHHTNHYFLYSDPSLRLAVRIREEENQKTLTFKLEQSTGRLEFNFDVDTLDVSIFKRTDVQKFLDDHNLKGSFEYLGSLQTQRHILKEDSGELCLDVCSYLDVIDYELEYEVLNHPHLAHQRFIEILSLENISPNEPETKFARFLKQKRLTSLKV